MRNRGGPPQQYNSHLGSGRGLHGGAPLLRTGTQAWTTQHVQPTAMRPPSCSLQSMPCLLAPRTGSRPPGAAGQVTAGGRSHSAGELS